MSSQRLQASKTAVILGAGFSYVAYSLPDYDEALIEFFTRCAAVLKDLTICILSPTSGDLLHRWKSIAPRAHVQSLPGLPEALTFL
jgi:hypothetical protein